MLLCITFLCILVQTKYPLLTKEKILTEIYISKEVDEVISKIQPDYLQQDVKQHAFMVLFEKEETFILDLHIRGKIRHYVVKTIYNTANFKGNKFLRQHRRDTEIPTESFPCTPCETNFEEEDLIKRCNTAKNELYWYNKRLLEMYVEHDNYRTVAQLTQIPLNSVYEAVKKARNEIKKKVWA